MKPAILVDKIAGGDGSVTARFGIWRCGGEECGESVRMARGLSWWEMIL